MSFKTSRTCWRVSLKLIGHAYLIVFRRWCLLCTKTWNSAACFLLLLGRGYIPGCAWTSRGYQTVSGDPRWSQMVPWVPRKSHRVPLDKYQVQREQALLMEVGLLPSVALPLCTTCYWAGTQGTPRNTKENRGTLRGTQSTSAME